VVLATFGATAEGPAEAVAIEHATVFVPGGPPIKDATVVLAGGKVAAVGRGVAVPAGARRIDAQGKVVTPGLIDAFGQAGLTEIEAEDTANDTHPPGALLPSFRLRDGYNPRSAVVPISRAGGVTTVVLESQSGILSGEAAAVDLAGDRLERALVRDAAAQVAVITDASVTAFAGARGEAWRKLRTALEDARFYAANRAAYDGNRTRPLSLPRPDLEALLPVLRGEEPLVIVAHRASDIELALKLADDFKLKWVLAGAAEAWLMAPELATHKVPVIVDPWANLPASFDRLRARDDLAALLAKAGVEVIVATFTPNESRQLWQRAGDAVRFGMDHDAAVRAVTEAPAKAFGLKGYGRLEAGAVGNVVVWSGDPLQTSTRVEHVFVRGVEESLVTRQTELLKRYRRMPGSR
jgi:imidazolonepropionase-like amidohydrolase